MVRAPPYDARHDVRTKRRQGRDHLLLFSFHFSPIPQNALAEGA